MGTWDVGIFDDDVACDVRDHFERAVASHTDIGVATQTVLEVFAESVEDPDDGPIIYLALAVLQVERGVLQPEIRAAALNIITSGQDLLRWESVESVTKRRRVLEELQRQLLAK